MVLEQISFCHMYPSEMQVDEFAAICKTKRRIPISLGKSSQAFSVRCETMCDEKGQWTRTPDSVQVSQNPVCDFNFYLSCVYIDQHHSSVDVHMNV